MHREGSGITEQLQFCEPANEFLASSEANFGWECKAFCEERVTSHEVCQRGIRDAEGYIQSVQTFKQPKEVEGEEAKKEGTRGARAGICGAPLTRPLRARMDAGSEREFGRSR